MKSLKLIYWQNDIDNYGDLLSPYIISRLSGRKVVHKNYFVGNLKSHLFHVCKSLSKFDYGFKVPYLFPFEKPIIGIGSILHTGNRKANIWGAGFMGPNDRLNGGKVYAVRGKYSLEIIKRQIEAGDDIKLMDDVALGDPALLLPLLLPLRKSKKRKIGIIPHFSEYEYFNENYGKTFHIINLQSTDVEKVTLEIVSCSHILSSSLHGIIVAHAYGIPAIWIEYSGLEKETKGFKFKDYFSAVGISEYHPLTDFGSVLKDEAAAMECFSVYKDSVLPTINLKALQDNLLESAPFEVK